MPRRTGGILKLIHSIHLRFDLHARLNDYRLWLQTTADCRKRISLQWSSTEKKDNNTNATSMSKKKHPTNIVSTDKPILGGHKGHKNNQTVVRTSVFIRDKAETQQPFKRMVVFKEAHALGLGSRNELSSESLHSQSYRWDWYLGGLFYQKILPAATRNPHALTDADIKILAAPIPKLLKNEILSHNVPVLFPCNNQKKIETIIVVTHTSCVPGAKILIATTTTRTPSGGSRFGIFFLFQF